MKSIDKFFEESKIFGGKYVKEEFKKYVLEIVNDAFDAGFSYGIGSHRDFIQTRMSKYEYSQKLHKEL